MDKLKWAQMIALLTYVFIRPPPLGEKGSYDFTTANMSVCQ